MAIGSAARAQFVQLCMHCTLSAMTLLPCKQRHATFNYSNYESQVIIASNLASNLATFIFRETIGE